MRNVYSLLSQNNLFLGTQQEHASITIGCPSSKWTTIGWKFIFALKKIQTTNFTFASPVCLIVYGLLTVSSLFFIFFFFKAVEPFSVQTTTLIRQYTTKLIDCYFCSSSFPNPLSLEKLLCDGFMSKWFMTIFESIKNGWSHS